MIKILNVANYRFLNMLMYSILVAEFNLEIIHKRFLLFLSTYLFKTLNFYYWIYQLQLVNYYFITQYFVMLFTHL